MQDSFSLSLSLSLSLSVSPFTSFRNTLADMKRM